MDFKIGDRVKIVNSSIDWTGHVGTIHELAREWPRLWSVKLDKSVFDKSEVLMFDKNLELLSE